MRVVLSVSHMDRSQLPYIDVRAGMGFTSRCKHLMGGHRLDGLDGCGRSVGFSRAYMDDTRRYLSEAFGPLY